MDSAEFVTLMLIDKGYYDYDFKSGDEADKKNEGEGNILKSPNLSQEELEAKLANVFGIGTKAKPKSLPPFELQRIAINDIKTE